MSETSHLPDSGFGKIFQTTYTGSLMGSGAVVMAVWPYVIANAKPPGVVELVPRYIAAVIGCNPADVSNAIEFLQAPDPESRSDIEEGRRLVHLTGHMYRVPTWSNYREKRDDEARKVYFREAKRKSRESKTVKDNLGKSNLSTQAEAEAEAEKDNTPLTPQGGNVAQSTRKKKDPHAKVTENTPLQIRINSWFGRKPTTLWTLDDASKLARIDPEQDDIENLDDWYSQPKSEIMRVTGYDPRTTTLGTLMNKWTEAADRARAFKADRNTP